MLSFDKNLFCTIAMVTIFASPSYAKEWYTGINTEKIIGFYNDFADAKKIGGQAMVDGYDRVYDKDVIATMTITNIFPSDKEGEDFTRSEPEATKRDKKAMMSEAKMFTTMIDYKDIIIKIEDMTVLEKGQIVHVTYKRLADFLMHRYGFKTPFRVKEDSTCTDSLRITDESMKIIKSSCTTDLYIDRRM